MKEPMDALKLIWGHVPMVKRGELKRPLDMVRGALEAGARALDALSAGEEGDEDSDEPSAGEEGADEEEETSNIAMALLMLRDLSPIEWTQVQILMRIRTELPPGARLGLFDEFARSQCMECGEDDDEDHECEGASEGGESDAPSAGEEGAEEDAGEEGVDDDGGVA